MTLELSKGGRRYGLLPSLKNPTTPRFKFQVGPPIPPVNDLTKWLGPVKDQKTLGACTAFARTGYAEYLYRRFKNQTPVFSPLFLYYMERKADGSLPQDAGSTGETAFRVFHDVGCCLESTDPYDVQDFNKEPTDEQSAEAAKYKHGTEHTLQTVDDVRYALASNYPVFIGVSLTESFEDGNWGEHNVMPAPAGSDHWRPRDFTSRETTMIRSGLTIVTVGVKSGETGEISSCLTITSSHP